MTGEEPAPLRYFLYGSCVSRDTFEFLPEPKELVRYVARQSLLSAGHAAPWAKALPRFKSAFQQRTSQEDVAGDVWEMVRKLAARTDLLVVDLLDERGGVYEADGSVITRTVERVGAGADEALASTARIIAFGSPEHQERWRDGWAAFVAHLDALGLRERTVVMAVPWADSARGGEDVPASFGLSAQQGNAAFEPYYAAVEESGIPLVRPRWWASSVRADADHQWGLAPFHYTDDVYGDVAEQLHALAGRSALRGEAT